MFNRVYVVLGTMKWIIVGTYLSKARRIVERRTKEMRKVGPKKERNRWRESPTSSRGSQRGLFPKRRLHLTDD